MSPIRSLSGVATRKPDAEALAEAIERYALAGNIAPWTVVELLPFLKQYHWDAYAREAGIASPSPATIALATVRFKAAIGFVDYEPASKSS